MTNSRIISDKTMIVIPTQTGLKNDVGNFGRSSSIAMPPLSAEYIKEVTPHGTGHPDSLIPDVTGVTCRAQKGGNDVPGHGWVL